MRFLLALVPAAALAAGNWYIAGALGAGDPITCVACRAWLVGGPLVLALLLAAMVPRAGAAEVAVVPAAPAPPAVPAEPPTDAALKLLAVLQEEGRLVDFLEEDLAPYSDEQIGAAARGIHDECQKALHERVALEPVLAGVEGERVTVDAGFDPAAIRLVGNVRGTPPFQGVLRHAGWRAKSVTLPARRGQNPRVIAPAEVEIA